jgi:hypothetical protein
MAGHRATLRLMTSQLPADCRQILALQAGVITQSQAPGAG